MFGGDDARSGNNLYDYLSYLTILFAVTFYFNKFDRLLVLLYVLVVSGIISAAYGHAQYFGWDPIGKNADQIRILASFGNTLNFSGYMVMAIPATIVVINMLYQKNKFLSILFITGLGLEISGLWLSAGRGPWVGALFGMIIFFLIIVSIKSLPWVGLIVALSWGFYNLVRKKINVDTDIGLLIESLFILPFALLAFYLIASKGYNDFQLSDPSMMLFIYLAGPMSTHKN